jgi:zinc transport system ATP-binding protein
VDAIILNVQRVCFGYPSFPVLENAHFHLHEGDFAAVIGANGAGKSTLLKIILGELVPQSGTVTLCGKNAADFTDRDGIAFLPQSTEQAGFAFPATALEMVGAPLAARERFFRGKKNRKKISRADIDRMAHNALALTGMELKERVPMRGLSGGERQRVLLSRALASEPRFLILDEPTTGVDSKSVETLFDVLSRLNRETRLTVVMATHDIARAAPFLNRIFCIEERNLQEITRVQIDREIGARHVHTNDDPHGECPDV